MRFRAHASRFLLAASTTLLVASPARATPNFPAALAADLSLAGAPDCSLCHTDGDQGGTGTVNTPFGKNMRARGLVAYDTSSLSAALALMSDEKVDSAGACLPDVEELQTGGDPNTPATGGCDGGAAPTETQTAVLLPTYGCATSSGNSEAPRPAVIVLAATLALVYASRSRLRRNAKAGRIVRRSR